MPDLPLDVSDLVRWPTELPADHASQFSDNGIRYQHGDSASTCQPDRQFGESTEKNRGNIDVRVEHDAHVRPHLGDTRRSIPQRSPTTNSPPTTVLHVGSSRLAEELAPRSAVGTRRLIDLTKKILGKRYVDDLGTHGRPLLRYILHTSYPVFPDLSTPCASGFGTEELAV
jgi:hypothetical protein